MPGFARLLGALRDAAVPCRGCLGPLEAGATAGLCGRCWSGLAALPAPRCPRCALAHGEEETCPDPVAWTAGDALWDYHAGRPELGTLLVPGIKAGEHGWRRELLARAARAALPAWVEAAEVVVPVPTQQFRRLLRGFDLAEEFARQLGRRLQRPVQPALARHWRAPRQSGRSESERRRLPRRAVRGRTGADVAGRAVLLVDDVWTTGATLLRSAQALAAAGAREVQVLTLFRAS